MTKANITQYDSTPSNNADINDINIAENCPASNINNAIRELMAHLKNVDTGSQALTALSVTGALSCGAFTSNGIDDNADAVAITISSAEKVTLTEQIASKAPAFRATMGSAQTFSTDTFTVVNFNTEVFDTNNNYDTSNFRFTPTIAGYYFFNAQIFVGTTSRVMMGFRKNGSSDTEVFQQGSNTTGGICYEASAVIQLNGSSDYIDAQFRHENGSDITSNNNTALTNFSGHLLMAT